MKATKAKVVAYAILGKISSLAGYFCGFVGIFGFINELTESFDYTGLVLSLVFISLAVFFIIKGMQVKHRVRRFKNYVSLISAQKMTSLDNISATTSQSLDFVKSDLQKMIDLKFFPKAYIDAAGNEIVIGNGSFTTPSLPSASGNLATYPETAVFVCSGCGASGSKPKGVHANCDYCGAYIK